MVLAGGLDLDYLYREYGHVVLRRARHILANEDEACDAMQEVFLSLTSRPSQFAGQSSITTFLYRVTTNLCLNKLRNHRRQSKLREQTKAGASREKQPGAEAVVDAQKVLMRLPEKLARVAVYYYVDEMTHEEIASLLGCSRRMVGKLVARIQREVEP